MLQQEKQKIADEKAKLSQEFETVLNEKSQITKQEEQAQEELKKVKVSFIEVLSNYSKSARCTYLL